MRSMFAKIFLSFWIAQILILFTTAFLLRRHFDSPEIQHRSLLQAMKINGNAAVAAYLGGGCPALDRFYTMSSDSTYLLNSDGQPICAEKAPFDFDELVRQVHSHRHPLVGMQVGSRYLWGVALERTNAEPWIFVLSGPYDDSHPLPLGDILSRLLIAVIVTGLVTFALALFLV